ncbi:amy [Symbiodinium natans]|uniref:Amy protein n=1 Tax=Symbiodinium natans TaxID=878477 RepID=A0A812L4E0_9DINO|nr:amy [Symbiodinium natans]
MPIQTGEEEAYEAYADTCSLHGDMASLTTQRCWDRRRCPREVVIGSDGTVITGTVPNGDLLAIYTGGRLDELAPSVCSEEEEELSTAARPHMIRPMALSLLLLLVNARPASK